MTATCSRVTETWVLDEPVVADAGHTDRRYSIRYVHRTIDADGDVTLSFHGVPITKNGKPNGTVGWRSIAPADHEHIAAMLPPVATT